MAIKSKAEAKVIADAYKEHRGGDTMSTGAYMFAIAVAIVAGIVFSVIGARTMMQLPLSQWGGWAFFGLSVGWFVVVLGAGMIAALAERWPVTALMFAIVTLATGAYLGPFVAMYEPQSVINILFYTVVITIVLGLAGALWPHDVEHWFEWLMKATLALVVALFALIAVVLALAAFKVSMVVPVAILSILDWVGIVLFSVWIFYDMNQALRMPANLNNAILNALNMYLNMVNIWIRLLAQFGQLKEVAGDVGSVAVDAVSSLADAV